MKERTISELYERVGKTNNYEHYTGDKYELKEHLKNLKGLNSKNMY